MNFLKEPGSLLLTIFVVWRNNSQMIQEGSEDIIHRINKSLNRK